MTSLSDIYTERPPLLKSELFLFDLDGVALGQNVYFPTREGGKIRKLGSVSYPGAFFAGTIEGRTIATPANGPQFGFLTLVDEHGDEVVRDFPIVRLILNSTVRRNALLTLNFNIDIGRSYFYIAANGIGLPSNTMPIVFNYA